MTNLESFVHDTKLEAFLRGIYLDDAENLAEIITRDNHTLSSKGITHTQVGDMLESLSGLAQNKFKNMEAYSATGAEIGGFVVYSAGWCGPHQCEVGRYFDERCGESREDYIIVRAEDKNHQNPPQILVAGIMPHMIKDHHFFQGNTPFRVDPGKAIDLLGLETGVDYSAILEEISMWFALKATDDTEADYNGSAEFRNTNPANKIADGVEFYSDKTRGLLVVRKPIERLPVKLVGVDYTIEHALPGQYHMRLFTTEKVVGTNAPGL